ncbi:tripartite tricarboxylate transporter TctB family protein [Pseudonocardia nematodicida]|uniref:Tripartite tricarboxylate transporter TctB family protein n=1 Tax=Pseudonocardia nematodicida TaxID=1206997 RepID=A0ABV1K5S5_9PSEU
MSTTDRTSGDGAEARAAVDDAVPAGRGIDRSGVVISATLLVVFVVALVLAGDWSFRAALTPLLVSGTGAALSGLYLVTALVGRRRGRPPSAGDRPSSGDETARVFREADRRSWVSALLWTGGFFLATWVLGLAVTAACFAAAYLRVQARSGWPACLLYAVAIGLTTWLLFGVVFEIALPEGLFG